MLSTDKAKTKINGVKKGKTVIGVDFDNTLISYDELMYVLAVERGLITPDIEKNKQAIRNQIRHWPGGEIEWQKIQAEVYGSRIGEAKLIDGVATFFRQCRRVGVSVYIVSHKTEFAAQDKSRTNLRQAALAWMEANHFFETEELGLSPGAVCFGATRQEKINWIQCLGCTHFIDDLIETFLESDFPGNVEKILYAPLGTSLVWPVDKVMNSWQEIGEYFFEDSDYSSNGTSKNSYSLAGQ